MTTGPLDLTVKPLIATGTRRVVTTACFVAVGGAFAMNVARGGIWNAATVVLAIGSCAWMFSLQRQAYREAGVRWPI